MKTKALTTEYVSETGFELGQMYDALQARYFTLHKDVEGTFKSKSAQLDVMKAQAEVVAAMDSVRQTQQALSQLRLSLRRLEE